MCVTWGQFSRLCVPFSPPNKSRSMCTSWTEASEVAWHILKPSILLDANVQVFGLDMTIGTWHDSAGGDGSVSHSEFIHWIKNGSQDPRGPKALMVKLSWNRWNPYVSVVFWGGAATEVYKMILKETGDAMSARVREVFQRRSMKGQSTHFQHSHMWMYKENDDCRGIYMGIRWDKEGRYQGTCGTHAAIGLSGRFSCTNSFFKPISNVTTWAAWKKIPCDHVCIIFFSFRSEYTWVWVSQNYWPWKWWNIVGPIPKMTQCCWSPHTWPILMWGGGHMHLNPLTTFRGAHRGMADCATQIWLRWWRLFGPWWARTSFPHVPWPLKMADRGLWALVLQDPAINGQWMAVNEDSQEVMMLSNTFGSSAFFSSFTSILTFAQVELGFHLQRHWRLMQRPGQRQCFAALGFQDNVLSVQERRVSVFWFGQVVMERSPTKNSCIGWRRATIWLRHCERIAQFFLAMSWKMSTENSEAITTNRCYEPFSDGWLITFVVALPILWAMKIVQQWTHDVERCCWREPCKAVTHAILRRQRTHLRSQLRPK